MIASSFFEQRRYNLKVTPPSRDGVKLCGMFLPDREGKVPRVALAGPGQEAAVDAPGQQELLCVNSGDVGVEPPKKHREKKGDERPYQSVSFTKYG